MYEASEACKNRTMKLISLDQLDSNSTIFLENDNGFGYWSSEIRYKSKLSWPGCVHNGSCGAHCQVLSFDEKSQNKKLFMSKKYIDCSEKRFSICYNDKNEDDLDYECSDCDEL